LVIADLVFAREGKKQLALDGTNFSYQSRRRGMKIRSPAKRSPCDTRLLLAVRISVQHEKLNEFTGYGF